MDTESASQDQKPTEKSGEEPPKTESKWSVINFFLIFKYLTLYTQG